MSEKQNIKTLRPAERIARAWRLALEFGDGYPISESEKQKFVEHPAAIVVHVRCAECGRGK